MAEDGGEVPAIIDVQGKGEEALRQEPEAPHDEFLAEFSRVVEKSFYGAPLLMGSGSDAARVWS